MKILINIKRPKQQALLRQDGVSLIESMIALFIFSIGVLGLASMQLTSLTSSGDSQQRSVAIWKAQEFADRIRSNPGLAAAYITEINNSSLATLGVDDATDAMTCPAGAPAVRCSDSSAGSGAVCSDAQKVTYDVWEVFCDPNTGVATTGAAVVDGSAGITDLEVFLRQNTIAADGNDDMALYFEWVSRAGDSNENITNSNGTAVNIATNLCGAATAVQVNSRLDVYCLRFRP